jgi:hypothetical protein
MPPTVYVSPVCPVSRNQAVAGMPGVRLPFIPRALDLASAIAAANALIQALAPGANLGASSSSGFGDGFSSSPGRGDSPGQDDGGGGKKKTRRWTEKDRKTCRIKYYYVDKEGDRDPDNWIIVERITYLKWHDRLQKLDFEFFWTYDIQDQLEDNSEFLSGDKGISEYNQMRRKFKLDTAPEEEE